jgi:hypothetical protein
LNKVGRQANPSGTLLHENTESQNPLRSKYLALIQCAPFVSVKTLAPTQDIRPNQMVDPIKGNG